MPKCLNCGSAAVAVRASGSGAQARYCTVCRDAKQRAAVRRWGASRRSMKGTVGPCDSCGKVEVRGVFTNLLLCQDCRAEVIRRHHQTLIARNRKFVDGLKKGVPCMDCGRVWHPVAMDFDHREPAKKFRSVSFLVTGGRSLDSIRTEIAKCDLVCACCHRIRTHGRAHGEGSLSV